VSFRSILFDTPEAFQATAAHEEPASFRDLNLDQIVSSITTGREAYDLTPLFYEPVREVATIRYRHEVFRDLGSRPLSLHLASFARQMREVHGRRARAAKLYYARQAERYFVETMIIYCKAVKRLASDLTAADLKSQGLREAREFLVSYTGSKGFAALRAEAEQILTSLAAIRYSLVIHGARIEVQSYEPESDYGAEVLQTFEKFKQGAPQEYSFKFRDSLEMNHVEAAIVDRVALLHPEVFSALSQYCVQHRDWLDAGIARFDREVQFYLAVLEHMEQLKPLPFCYPEVTARSKETYAREAFDLALAYRLRGDKGRVVTNDFHLTDPERILVISGANQGGKTTFARMFGQLHYLASLGCPVPARDARVFLFDELFTHFEKQERVESLSGKLEDELLRMHRILERVTSNSILVMNESFGATTLSDALFLSKEIFKQIIQRGMICVYVTFLDELASLDRSTVSMVSTVDPTDPTIRTFKVIRQPADGLAYALAIAQKYRLSYRDVKERIRS